MWFSFFITWEQRKLGELCEKFADGDWIEAKDQSSSGIRLIQTGNIGLGEYLDKPNNKKWISEDTFNRLHCEEVCTGDILISRLPEPAGRACIVPNLGTKMITAVDCTIVRISTKVSKKFLLQHLSSKKYFNEVNTCMAGGTRQRISRSNLANFNVLLPISFDEQESIGRVLCGLDNLITLHQRKQNDLFFLILGKKSSLILANDWEQRKLGELCEKFADGDWIEAKDQSSSGIRLIQTGNIGLGEYLDKPNNKKWISEDTFNRLHCEEVCTGDILISRLPEPAGRACIVPNLGTKMITAVDCTIVRISTKVSKKFLLQHLSSKKYFNEVNTCMAGGTRQRISRSNLANFNVLLPISFDEQESIGRVLCGLDNLITLHQCKGNLVQNKYGLHSLFQMQYKLADDWEQRKLGDIGRVAMNRRIFKEQTSAEGSVPFYKIGTFGGEPDAFISDELYQEYKERFPYPKVGDILLSASGSIGKMVEYKGEKAYFQDSNIVWLDHDARVLNVFLKCFYSVVKWAGLEGSTIKRLYNKNILETQIALPSSAEQCLIGDFFEHIDNLITLHQRGKKHIGEIKNDKRNKTE